MMSSAVGRLVLIAVLLVAMPSVARAIEPTGPEVTELDVEAAYIYKFASYVDWPVDAFQSSSSPITIGILRSDELASRLSAATRGKSIRGRAFVVRRLKATDDLGQVNILFIGSAEPAAAEAILVSIRDKPVLTVSDSRRVFARGTIINLIKEGERLRFEVSLRPVARSRLKLSALMLSAAVRVQRDEP